jgi:hypothetical protein
MRYQFLLAFPATTDTTDLGSTRHIASFRREGRAVADFIDSLASLTSSLIGTEGTQQVYFHDW